MVPGSTTLTLPASHRPLLIRIELQTTPVAFNTGLNALTTGIQRLFAIPVRRLLLMLHMYVILVFEMRGPLPLGLTTVSVGDSVRPSQASACGGLVSCLDP